MAIPRLLLTALAAYLAYMSFDRADYAVGFCCLVAAWVFCPGFEIEEDGEDE